MPYRKILAPILGTSSDIAAIKAAFGFGRQFGAHVEVLHVRVDPVRAIPYGYVGTDVSGHAAQYAIEAAIKAAEQAQKAATDTFKRAVEKSGIEVTPKPGARADATTTFKIVQGDFLDEIERASRLSDLVVFGPTNGGAEHETLREGLEAVLLSGSRPVLFVPKDPPEGLGQRVAVAYDGSATAAHAVTAALPFLSRAKSVHSFEVTDATGKSEPLADLHDYLTLRGIEAVEHVIDPGPKSTAEALSLAVQGQRCDLLVLGGYGHSRLREFVLGGVTRHILRHATPFAVLMTH